MWSGKAAMEKAAPSPKTVMETKGWTITAIKDTMFGSDDVATLHETLKIQRIPDICFGNNCLSLVYPQRDFAYTISTVESLELCGFLARTDRPLLAPPLGVIPESLAKTVAETNVGYQAKKEVYNPINAIPPAVLARQAEAWKDKNYSSIKDFQTIDIISDWTYSTPYKGTPNYLAKLPHLVPGPAVPALSASCITVAPTAESIPLHKLGKDNPVRHYDEVPLFEDDLDDLGLAQAFIRYRVMDDSFYVLLRNYVRLDEMLVRIFDTRLYHAFETNELLREFQYKDSTYAELRTQGFKVGSEWILSPSQADEVFPMLALKIKVTEKITF